MAKIVQFLLGIFIVAFFWSAQPSGALPLQLQVSYKTHTSYRRKAENVNIKTKSGKFLIYSARINK